MFAGTATGRFRARTSRPARRQNPREPVAENGCGAPDHAFQCTTTSTWDRTRAHPCPLGWPVGAHRAAPPRPQAGKTGIIDGTEIRVRRPALGRKDRDRFISGKNKQNAVKVMVFTDGDGRLLFCSPAKPGSCADITAAQAA
ncbi:transposase family protein [Streptomyces sp. NPDC017524]|uniref:transposase family protein n=1 Tax=unclassified Streptomyces TaxID=2593676 RepID=UPI0037AD3946